MARTTRTRTASKPRRTTEVTVETKPEETPAVEAEETKPEATTPKPKAKKKAKVWEPLDADTLAWVRENARPAVSPCLCGCGQTTKGRFFPGHDATLKARLEANDDQVTLAAFGW